MSRSKMRGVTMVPLLIVSLATVMAGAATRNLVEDCPRHLGSLLVEPRSVGASGTTAVISTYWAGLTAVDVSDPTAPRRRGTLLGRYTDVAVSGAFAYAASAEGQLQVLDLSDPTRLQVVASTDVSAAYSVVLDGGYAYVGAEYALVIVDISDPLQPTVVSSAPLSIVDESHLHVDIAVDNGFVYYPYGSSVMIIDATEVTEPVQVGQVSTAVDIATVAASGDTVCALGYTELSVINVTVPSRPAVIGHAPGLSAAYDMAIVGTRAVATGGSLNVYDISTPQSPRLISTDSGARGYQLAVDGSTAYQVGAWFGTDFQVIDLQDIDHPVLLGSLDLPNSLQGAVISGQHAFVATADDGNGGLLVVDISDPSLPQEISKLELGDKQAIVVGNDHAFLAQGTSRLAVADISDPSRPRSVGGISLPGSTVALALRDDLLAVADYDGAIRTVDVSDPARPQLLATLSTPAAVLDIALVQTHAYAAAADAGLLVIDMADPAQPLIAGSLDTPGSARGVAVLGSTVYVADLEGGLRVIDVSDPGHPVEITSLPPLSSEVEAVAVSDSHVRPLLMIAEWGNIVRLLDITSPFEPIEVTAEQLHAGHLSLSGSLAALTSPSYDGGLHLLDIADCLPLVSTWIGIAAHQAGSFGSTWVTDLVVDNPTGAPAPVELLLHTPTGSYRAESTILAGAQGVFEDVVGVIGTEGAGALEVRAGQPLDMIARIANVTEQGTFGQLLQGYRSAEGLAQGAAARLLGLRQHTGLYRSNLTITNTSDAPATVRISLFTSNGELLVSYSQEVAAKQVWQDNEPFRRRAGAANLGWGFAEIEVMSGGGILASASVIDSRTNDPTTSSPVRSDP